MDEKEFIKERNLGMTITCARCRKFTTRVKWIDHSRWRSGTMTSVIPPVIAKEGWKTINSKFICPFCLTEEEKITDFSKPWYDSIYEKWNEFKEV